MRLNVSHIATNYGRIAGNGDLYFNTYSEKGIVEILAKTAQKDEKADYIGPVFIITDGAKALQNLKMWLYYNNNQNHACDLDVNWYDLKPKLKVSPRGDAEPYELSQRIGTILGVKDGLPIELPE